MAQFVYQYHYAIPAGTSSSSPSRNTISVPDLTIERVELEVPHGPAGTMGFAIFSNKQQWQPVTAGEWLVWDGKTDGWWLNGQQTGGNWEIVGYNTGKLDHTVYVRFFVNPLPAPPTPDAPDYTFLTRDVAGGETVVL